MLVAKDVAATSAIGHKPDVYVQVILEELIKTKYFQLRNENLRVIEASI